MRNRVVVIVDDDAAYVEIFTDLLAGEAYRAVGCLRSREAHDLIRQEQPAAVILDVRIEQKDSGWALLDLLRADPATTGIPVILCSADEHSLLMRAGWLRERGYDYLAKPFCLHQLLPKIERAILSAAGSPASDAGCSSSSR